MEIETIKLINGIQNFTWLDKEKQQIVLMFIKALTDTKIQIDGDEMLITKIK